MELIEQQKIVLRDYEARQEKLISQRNYLQEKVDALEDEINRGRMIIEITKKAIGEVEAKNSA